MSELACLPAPVASQDTATIVVAPIPHGAARGWRRLIQAIDPSRDGAYALTGQSLDPGGAYRAPCGALIVVVDTYPQDRHIRVLRIRAGGLELVKEWRQKAPLGARAVKAIVKAMPRGEVHRAGPIAGVANRFPGRCYRCGEHVSGGAGNVVRVGGASRVTHTDQCPPVPAKPNERDGRCSLCGKPVPAGTGLVERRWDDVTSAPWWTVSHEVGACRAAPEHLPNQWTDWCAGCAGLVHAREGHWRDGAVWHATSCRPTPALPSWRVTSRDTSHQRGDVLRVNVRPRPGERDVPAEAPGRSVLDEGIVSLIVTVLDVRSREDGIHMALVRAATWDEACETLVAEVELAVDAQPNLRGFKAAWSAEKIGPSASGRARDARGCTPWLAEITGHDRVYGYQRVFQPARRDYLNANGRGTRGVVYRWVLSPNAVYEAYRPVNWSRGERLFLRVTADGGTEEITREQVEARLRHGLTWSEPGDGED